MKVYELIVEVSDQYGTDRSGGLFLSRESAEQEANSQENYKHRSFVKEREVKP